MSNDTRITASLECEELFDSMDKAAAKVESFSKKAGESIDKVDKKIKTMSENEKRAYDALKSSYDKHSAELKRIASDYEALRVKRKAGEKLTESEWASLHVLTSDYKKHSGALRNVSKELDGIAKASKNVVERLDINSIMNATAGGVSAILISKFSDLLLDFGKAVVSVGTKTQQTISQFDAMANSISNGAVAYQAFNDVTRNTNYEFDAVDEMGKRLLNMGYSAKDAAGLIQLCSDTAAGLGQGQAGAEELVRTISMIQTAGKMEEDQLANLQMAGLNVDEIFSTLGLTGVEAMTALRNGTLDGQTAVKALTDYMHKFDGSMAKSKDNLVDMWGDVAGNAITACGEIGTGIANIVKESEMMQVLIDFTQSMIDLVRGEGCQAWNDIGVVAQLAMDTIGNILQIVCTTIKLGVILVNELYDAFKTMCIKVYERLKFILEPLGEVFKIFSGILSLAGQEIKSGVDVSFKETFKQEALPDEKSQFRKGLDRSSTTKTSEGTRIAQEEQKKYQAILDDTKKIQEEITKESAKRIGIDRELSMVGKSRIDQLKAERKWIDEDVKHQKAAEDELFEKRKENIQAQIDYYNANPGLPGASETLKALNEQITKEQELHDKRIANIEAEGEARIATNEATRKALGMETNPGGDLSTDSVDGFSLGLDKFMQSEEYLEDIGIKLTQLDKLAANTLGKGFASAFEAIVNGSKSASEAFSDMAKQLLVQCANLLAQWTAIFALVTIWRGPQEGAKAANKMVLGLANGGYVSGPGTATSDSIPAMLSNGEYVINASAVQALGVGTMDMINSGQLPVARFAQGGMVGGNGGSASISLHVSALDAASFEGFLQSGGLDKIKQALFDNDRNFAGLAGVW